MWNIIKLLKYYNNTGRVYTRCNATISCVTKALGYFPYTRLTILPVDIRVCAVTEPCLTVLFTN